MTTTSHDIDATPCWLPWCSVSELHQDYRDALEVSKRDVEIDAGRHAFKTLQLALES